MDEHVAKVVTDLPFGTGCWPCGRTHSIDGHIILNSRQMLEKFQKKTLANTGKAHREAQTVRQRRERIWAASVRARARAISM